jgi:hypothetical protein
LREEEAGRAAERGNPQLRRKEGRGKEARWMPDLQSTNLLDSDDQGTPEGMVGINKARVSFQI